MLMGILGSFFSYLLFRSLRSIRVNLAVSGFLAGIVTDWVTYTATSCELALGIRGDASFLPLFWKILLAFVPTQLQPGILERIGEEGCGIAYIEAAPQASPPATPK